MFPGVFLRDTVVFVVAPRKPRDSVHSNRPHCNRVPFPQRYHSNPPKRDTNFVPDRSMVVSGCRRCVVVVVPATTVRGDDAASCVGPNKIVSQRFFDICRIDTRMDPVSNHDDIYICCDETQHRQPVSCETEWTTNVLLDVVVHRSHAEDNDESHHPSLASHWTSWNRSNPIPSLRFVWSSLSSSSSNETSVDEEFPEPLDSTKDHNSHYSSATDFSLHSLKGKLCSSSVSSFSSCMNTICCCIIMI